MHDLRLSKISLAVAAAVVGSLGLWSGAARAEYQPLSLTLSENIQHDANLFRVPSYDTLSPDWLYSTGVELKMDKTYRRQEYVVDVNASSNHYQRNSNLDYTGYNASLGFTSEIASKLKLSLNGQASQGIAPFGIGSTKFDLKNVQNSDTLSAQLQYGLFGRLSVYGGFSSSSLHYDIVSLTYPDRHMNTSNIGVQYMPNGEMTYGLGWRHGTGAEGYGGPSFTDPSDSSLSDDVTRDDIDLTGSWQISGLSSLNARISSTDEQHTQEGINSYKGITWQISWNYTPTGKTSFNTFLERDTNNSANTSPFAALSPTFGIAQGLMLSQINQIATIFGANANWQATSKITLGAQLSYTEYNTTYNQQQNLLQDIPSQSATGHSVAYGLNVTYTPRRFFSLSCGAQKIDRSADLTTLGYETTLYNCMGNIILGGQ